jgi:hypothetical protein
MLLQMKKMYPIHALKACMMLLGFFAMHYDVQAQSVIIPAANTNTASNRKPYSSNQGFERTGAIYTAAEIGPLRGQIGRIGFYVNAATAPQSVPVKIYLKSVTAAAFTAGTWASEIATATLVYDATIPGASFVANNWIDVVPTVLYNYTGGNMAVLVETNAGGTGNENTTAKQFRWSNGAANSAETWAANTIAPTGNGTLSTSRPNIKLDIRSNNRVIVEKLVSPLVPFCSATPYIEPVKINIKNEGFNNVNPVTINWELDGTAQAPINYSTNLTTTAPNNVAEINLGNINFAAAMGHTFKVWISNPNNLPNTATPPTDTLAVRLGRGLSGVYTVGGANPDFINVAAAVDALNAFGVCGSVIFNIRDSNYVTGAGVITSPIKNWNNANRITFQSENGVAANVVINSVGTNLILGISNVSNITVRNLTFKGQGNIIELNGAASNDTITGCRLEMTNNTSVGIGITTTTFNGQNTVITNNEIDGGAAAIRLPSTAALNALGTIIDDNTVTRQNATGGIILVAHKSPKVRDNIVSGGTGGGAGIQVSTSTTPGNIPIEITGNDISYTAGAGTYNPMTLTTTKGTAATRMEVSNNKINVAAATSTNGFTNVDFVNFHHNTININNTAAANNDFATGINQRVYANTIQIRAASGTGITANSATASRYYNNTINFIQQTGATGAIFGFRANTINTDTIHNNTIQVETGNSASFAGQFNLSAAANKDNLIANNVFYLNTSVPTSTGVGFLWNTVGTPNISDCNNIFASNNRHFSNNGTIDTSLNNWRKVVKQELNSICYAPVLTGSELHPDASAPANWSLNGRAMQLSFSTADKDNQVRISAVANGVPDIGAFEFVPAVIPPLAKALPFDPQQGGKQIFTFGQDTVATIEWATGMIVPSYIQVRAYSGVKPPSFLPPANFMYFYADIETQNMTYDFNPTIYYKDIWRGTTGAESGLRIARKLPNDPTWTAYNTPMSTVNTTLNRLTGNNFTSTGYFTGIEDNVLFSAIVTPVGATVFCPGNTVQLDANTGTGYTYQWYFNGNAIPGATGPSYIANAAGDYYVVISDVLNNTATSSSVALTVVSPPSANITASGPLTYCTGGQLTLHANTGLDLTYQWQLNGNNIPAPDGKSVDLNVGSAGNYTVTVRNIGCATTSPITTVAAGPLVTNLGSDTSFCQSVPLVLDAGYPGAKYLWSTGDTTQTISITSQSGTYSVYVDAGPNCQDRDTIEVNIDLLPTVVGISSTVINGSTFNLSPSGDVNANSYMWIHGDGTKDFTRTTTHTYSIMQTNTWNVWLVVFNDCGTDSTYLDLRTLLSVEDLGNEKGLLLYPNPAYDNVTCTINNDVLEQINVVNNLGQTVLRTKADRNSTTISVAALPAGTYVLTATTRGGKTLSKKLEILR